MRLDAALDSVSWKVSSSEPLLLVTRPGSRGGKLLLSCASEAGWEGAGASIDSVTSSVGPAGHSALLSVSGL